MCDVGKYYLVAVYVGARAHSGPRISYFVAQFLVGDCDCDWRNCGLGGPRVVSFSFAIQIVALFFCLFLFILFYSLHPEERLYGDRTGARRHQYLQFFRYIWVFYTRKTKQRHWH